MDIIKCGEEKVLKSTGSEFQSFAPRKANDLWPLKRWQCGPAIYISTYRSNNRTLDGAGIYAPWRECLSNVIEFLQTEDNFSRKVLDQL